MKSLVSPCNDYVFKLIFGDQKNIDILASFLKAVLDIHESEFESLTIIDPHFRKEQEQSKEGILDVKVRTKSGKVIDVEIQVHTHDSLRERIVYYASKMYTEQLTKGESYDELKKVVSIVIMAEDVLIKENSHYHNAYYIHDPKTDSYLIDKMEIHILELKKVLKDESNREILYFWMLFFKARDKEELEMLMTNQKVLEEPAIGKACGRVLELSEDEATRMIAENREKYLRDEDARIKTALRKGREEGELVGELRGELIGVDKTLELISQGYTPEQIKEMMKKQADQSSD
jgi:predicted transposase/invertase (TIGR01784 family)